MCTNTVSFLLLYDDTINQSIIDEDFKIKGLSIINLKGDLSLYERFKTKGILINILPIIIISYQGILKKYIYNRNNIEKVKQKIKMLLI